MIFKGFFSSLIPVGVTQMTENLMSKTTNVVRRGPTYYFRMRVPSDLIAHYGKKEITHSLKTKERREATRLGLSEALKWHDKFAAARLTLLAVNATAKRHNESTLTQEDIRGMAQGFMLDVLEEDESHRRMGVPSKDFRLVLDILEPYARAINANHRAHDCGDGARWFRNHIRQEASFQNIQIDSDSDLEKELVYEFAQATMRAIAVIEKRNEGYPVPTPDRPTVAVIKRSDGSTSNSEMRLSAVIDKYRRERSLSGEWNPKTADDYQAVFDLLVKVIGDLNMSELSTARLRQFKETLISLPANINKNPLYRGKSIEEILALPDVKPLSSATVDKCLTRVSSLFGWAHDNDFIPKNFAENLSIRRKKRNSSAARNMFDEGQLTAIFDAIASGRVTTRGQVSSFHYWGPLLAYTTGARVNEIGSLRPQDFDIEDGVPFIAITQQNDDEKETKSLAGIRMVPVHPALIRLGLLDYVQRIKTEGLPRIFPELRLTKNGYGDKITRWFSGGQGFLKRQAGITTDKTSFHSFRHTMTTNLERSEVGVIMTKRILGHSLEDDVTYGTYSKGVSMAQMKVAIVKAAPDGPLMNLPEFPIWCETHKVGRP